MTDDSPHQLQDLTSMHVQVHTWQPHTNMHAHIANYTHSHTQKHTF